MKLSPLTIDRLKTYISGDKESFPKLSGPEILTLFHSVGFKDVYEWGNGGMPNALSRNAYVVEKLKEINGKKEMQTLLETVVSKSHFLETGLDLGIAVQTINVIIKADGYEFVDAGGGEYKISGALLQDVVQIEAYFEENRNIIIEEIRRARFLIWVAVAWLTDVELLRELHAKKNLGVNIQIVVMDDEINAKLKPKVLQHFEAYYKLPQGAYKNLMHHKFCIIDLKTVVHGSYNWTVKAQYNKETVTVNHSHDFAAGFAETFINLKLA